MSYTKETLEAGMKKTGCQHPDCRCGELRKEMWLYSKCHPEYPHYAVETEPGKIELQCCNSACYQKIGLAGEFVEDDTLKGEIKRLSMSDGELHASWRFMDQECHPEAPLRCRYDMGTGVVTMTCYECKAEVGKIKLRENDADV